MPLTNFVDGVTQIMSSWLNFADKHVNDVPDSGVAHAASKISNTPAGTIAATDVQSAINELDSEKVGASSPTLTGDIYLNGAVRNAEVAVGALDINCASGNYFTKTINGNSTFTVSNVPATGVFAFTLQLEHTSGTITWFSGVEWPNSTAPTLTTGKTHLFMFVTSNGGTRWYASSLINYTT